MPAGCGGRIRRLRGLVCAHCSLAVQECCPGTWPFCFMTDVSTCMPAMMLYVSVFIHCEAKKNCTILFLQ